MPRRVTPRQQRRRQRFAPLRVGASTPTSPTLWDATKDLDQPQWAKNGVTVDANLEAGLEPLLTNVDLLEEDGSNGLHYLSRPMVGANDNTSQAVTFYTKPGTRVFLGVRSRSKNGTMLTTILNCTTGALVTLPSGHQLGHFDMGQGWHAWRITLTGAALGSGATAPQWQFHVMKDSAQISYQGVAGLGLRLWDVQWLANDAGLSFTPPYPVLPNTATRLPVGIANFTEIGKGAGGTTDPNKYYRVIGPYAPSPGSIEADVLAARAAGVKLVWFFAGSRTQWAPGGVYSRSLWRARQDRFKNLPLVAEALANKEAYLLLVDEPNHSDFGSPSTISPQECNEMGHYVKSIWSHPVTYVRLGSKALAVDGWNNTDDVPVPVPTYFSQVLGRNTSGYSGIDYGFSQYSIQHHSETPSEYYAREKAEFAAVNLGMIPAMNYWNGGLEVDNDGVDACWDINDNNSSSGVITGPGNNGPLGPGVSINCGSQSTIQQQTHFVASPEWRQHVVAIAATDPDAIFFTGFGDVSGGVPSLEEEPFPTLSARPDFVSAMQNCVILGNARTVFNGLRPIK